MLCAFSCVAEGKPCEKNDANCRNGSGCQIGLRRVALKIREPCGSSDKYLRKRADYGADNGAHTKQLCSLNPVWRNGKSQCPHGDVERSVCNIEANKQDCRVNNVEHGWSIRAANEKQNHNKGNKPGGPI